MKTIKVGDILYEPRDEKILEVLGFGEDVFGQHATFVSDGGKIERVYTSYFVFKYFSKLGSVLRSDYEQ